MVTRTPRRTASKRTPYAARVKKEEVVEASTNLVDLISYYKEKDKVRDEYIKALREENQHLRTNAVGGVDYSGLIGLSVSKVGNELHCTHSIEKEGKVSSISFVLASADSMYTYTYKCSNIEDLPEYLKKEIYFDADQVKLFFFNVYECVAKRE